jgi:tetratricopeptide (TPR) repeat protein
MLKYFCTEEVARILKIETGRLKYWNRIDLVKPSVREYGKNFYDFQDLICLRTAQGLTAKGMPASAIKKSIDLLKKRIPDIEEQLNNKRIYAFGNRIIISHKNRLIDTQSGQMFFRFDVDDLIKEIEKGARIREQAKTAEDWFEEGLRHDSNGESHDKALQAYREALKLNPNYTDAYVNMGTVYYNQQKYLDAERCYRLALSRDPYHAKAHFNLGNVLDEFNCTEEAIRYYQKSLESDPTYADAFYNLARALEKQGQWDKAVRHWKSYLRFDAVSKHAEFARKRVKYLQSQLAAPMMAKS